MNDEPALIGSPFSGWLLLRLQGWWAQGLKTLQFHFREFLKESVVATERRFEVADEAGRVQAICSEDVSVR